MVGTGVPLPQCSQIGARKDDCLSRVAQAISSGFTLIELLVFISIPNSGYGQT